MIGIDLFAGAGGMSLGAKYAGIKTKIAVEKDVYAGLTYSRNFKNTTVVIDDIQCVKEFVFDNSKKEPVILYGGPPCQGFSNSNQRNRGLDNPKNWLFREFIRVTKQIKPDWVLIENVKGLTTQDSGFFLDLIISKLNNLGYTVNFKVLNSVNFGVPQKRDRIFIAGSLHGIAMDFFETSNNPHVTVKEAIEDLPFVLNGQTVSKLLYSSKPNSKYSKKLRKGLNEVDNNLVTRNSQLVLNRYKHVPQGGNWEDIPGELMTNYADRNRCHTGIYHRLEWDKPSKVIGNFRKNMLIHPLYNRGISVREAARIQSFPDDHIFEGSIGFQQQQVADAVPPFLAKSVFNQIINNS